MKSAERSTSTKGLPFQDYNGLMTFVGGFPRIGKTSLVLDEVPHPFLFLCTDVSNPSVKKLNFVEDDEEGIQYALDHPTETMAVRCYHHSERIFELMNDHRRALVLDEIGNLFSAHRMRQRLLEWAREVGYRDGGLQVWATSQRAAADVWPGVYTASRRIKWVGPLHSDEAIRTLFSHRSYDMDIKEFRAKLSNLKPYSWQRKNVKESVLVVKDI